MIKKNKKLNKQSKKHGYIIITTGLVLMALISLVAGYQLKAWQISHVAAPTKERITRITDIYSSLKLGEEYQLTSSNIFGDRQVYDWDASRSYSSSQTYERGANVDTTVAELRKAIEAAGFTYFDEPYAGSTFIELHFKSAKSEYIRLNVQSKPRFDAMRNEILMNSTVEVSNTVITMDPNAGPSKVTIKVNLDDNNE